MNSLLIVFLIISCLFIITLLVFLYMAWEAKRSLLKGGVSWSAKKINITRSSRNGERDKKPKGNNILEDIDRQSNEFLRSQQDDNHSI